MILRIFYDNTERHFSFDSSKKEAELTLENLTILNMTNYLEKIYMHTILCKFYANCFLLKVIDDIIILLKNYSFSSNYVKYT